MQLSGLSPAALQSITEYFAANPGELTPHGLLNYMLHHDLYLSDVIAAANISRADALAWFNSPKLSVSDYLLFLNRLVPPPVQWVNDGDILVLSDYVALPDPQGTMLSALEKYHARDATIDPGWGYLFGRMASYYREGQFNPGASTASPAVFAQAMEQWARDNEPSLLDKIFPYLLVAAAAYLTYGVVSAAGEVVPVSEVVASTAAYPTAATTAEELMMLGVTPETTAVAVQSIAAGAPGVIASTSGLTAAQVVGTAKTVLGVAGTVTSVVNLAKNALGINPVTGAPNGLPAGYQPIIDPNAPGGVGMPLDFSGMINQFAIPAAILAGIYILKG